MDLDFRDSLPGDEEDDRPECPECDSADLDTDYYNDRYLDCNNCGNVFDPESGESVEDFTVDLYCHVEGMTPSDAKDYIYEMLAEIERSAGFRIYFDKLT